MIKRRKIAVIGAGKVGATIAYTLAVQQIASEIVLIDMDKKKAEGEATDIIHSAHFIAPIKIYAGEYEDLAHSDIVIHSFGIPRQPGMTRIDLAGTNVGIFKEAFEKIVPYTSESVHIIVSNPVDILTYAVIKTTGLPVKRVIGSGTLLDTSRLRAILAELTGKSSANIDAYVLAEHGDTSLIPWSMVTIFGMNAVTYVEQKMGLKDPEWKDKILNDVRKAGSRVIANKGATQFAISMSVVDICRYVFGDSNTILTLGSMLNGQYGIDDVCLSLPFSVGAEGLGECFLPNLAPEEEAALVHSADSLKAICRELKL
jgi:L-lactate dehydrogenase